MSKNLLLCLVALLLSLTAGTCSVTPEDLGLPTALPTIAPGRTPTLPAAPAATVPANRMPARVLRVVDGDTIQVEIDGQELTVRYIGVDTPETVKPNNPIEWMGPEASAANKALVEGQIVYLEKDVSETDRYGRLLRYVYLADGTFVNAELVRQGYAQVVTYPPDVKYHDLFLQIQQEARDAQRGLWSSTAEPGAAAQATATVPLPAAVAPGATVVIIAVDKRAEYVDLQNVSDGAVDLAGWVLVSERGNQRCPLGGTIEAGATLRVWALAADAAQGGFNCGLAENIWSNSDPDPAVLYDAQGQEVARK